MKAVVIAILSLVWASVALAQGYTIKPGDTLQIEVLEDPTLNRQVLVLPDGSINFPFAGAIRASGLSTAQVQDRLTAGIASNFADTPNVFVTVGSIAPRTARSGPAAPATIDIYMIGEVGAPGVKTLERGTTLLQALAATGGFTRFAATKRIQLRRTDPVTGNVQSARINYKAIAEGAEIMNDVVLADGDVIIVPERRLFE